jgi:hypothetical protein
MSGKPDASDKCVQLLQCKNTTIGYRVVEEPIEVSYSDTAVQAKDRQKTTTGVGVPCNENLLYLFDA